MSDKIPGNGHDDSIDKESHNPDLSNNDDSIFNDDFSDVEDNSSLEDFEESIDDDFSGFDDVETGDVINDYLDGNDEEDGSSRVIVGEDNQVESEPVSTHEFENDEFGEDDFGEDDFGDISEFDSTPESTAILHEDSEDANSYPEDNSSDWDEEEFSDPINDEDVAITSNNGTVFDDEETPYYNDNYGDEDIEIDDLDAVSYTHL